MAAEIELTIVVELGYADTMVLVASGVKLVRDGLFDHPLLASTSLVFVPCGIRVLTAFLIGTRSIISLMICSLISAGLGLNGGIYPLASLVPGVICGYLAFNCLNWQAVSSSEGSPSPGDGVVLCW